MSILAATHISLNRSYKEKKMQDTINISQEETEPEKSQDHGHCPTLSPFKRSRGPMRLLPALMILLFALIGHGTSVAQMSHATAVPVKSDAQKAFEIMKTLAGSWDGNIMGLSTHITIRV